MLEEKNGGNIFQEINQFLEDIDEICLQDLIDAANYLNLQNLKEICIKLVIIGGKNFKNLKKIKL